jgi:DNA-binding IclR family transcriptional regulator
MKIESFDNEAAEAKKERRGIQSVEVGGQLLVALVEHGAPMALRELAQKAGMTSAKAHPYMVSFGNIGLIQQDPVSGRYELGPFALQMGLISLQLLDPVKIAIPEVAALSERIGQTVALAVLGNNGPTIIHLNESNQPIHVKMRTGTVVSTLYTATGRIFSAYLPAKVAESLLDQEMAMANAAGRSTKKKPARQEIEKTLTEVRRHGLARSIGEPTAGIHALSAPVFDHQGNITLAVTVIGPSGTLDASWNGDAAQQTRECAGRISARMGYRG